MLTVDFAVAANDVDQNGYDVTTVLDGNKLGVAFHNIYDGAIGGQSAVALDVTTTSIYSVSLPLSQSKLTLLSTACRYFSSSVCNEVRIGGAR